MVRRRVDPVLTPDQLSVARPLQPEDLDRQVTRYSIYPHSQLQMVFHGVNT